MKKAIEMRIKLWKFYFYGWFGTLLCKISIKVEVLAKFFYRLGGSLLPRFDKLYHEILYYRDNI